MSKFLKSLFLLLTAGVFTTTGWAELVAEWTKFTTAEDLTRSGYTLTQVGSVTNNSDGSVTLGEGGEYYFTYNTDVKKQLSLVVEVSGIPTTNVDNPIALFGLDLSGGAEIFLEWNGTEFVQRYTQNGTTNAKKWGFDSWTHDAGRHTLIFTYKNDAGTHSFLDNRCIVTQNDSTNENKGANNLMWSNSTIGTVTIGGANEASLKSAEGMTIHSVQLYSKKVIPALGDKQIDESLAWLAQFEGNANTFGWVTSWNGTPSTYVATPKGQGANMNTYPHMGANIGGSFTVALYADISAVSRSDDKKPILFSLGSKEIALVKTATDKIQLYKNGQPVEGTEVENNDFATTGMFHLIVFGSDSEGSFLKVDTATAVTGETLGDPSGGLQIASVYGGYNGGNYATYFGQADDMILDEARGYNAKLDNNQLNGLAEKFVASRAIRTYTVKTASWDMAPATNVEVVIDFSDTENQSVDLTTILASVTSLAKLTVLGSNGTITKSGVDAVTVGELVVVETDVVVADSITCNKVTVNEGATLHAKLLNAKPMEINGTLSVEYPSGDIALADNNYKSINGRGKIKITNASGWVNLPDVANMFSSTLALENHVADGLILTEQSNTEDAVTYEVGTLSGEKPFRVDWGSGKRTIRIIQADNSEHQGGLLKDKATDRCFKISVAGAAGTTNKTLKLTGDTSKLALLEVESSGSVELNGDIKKGEDGRGNLTNYGVLKINGARTVDGTLTLGAGSTLDVTEGTLTANTLATLPSALTVKVANALEVDGTLDILTTTSMPNTASTTVTVKVEDEEVEGNYSLVATGKKLQLVRKTEIVTVEVDVSAAGGTYTFDGANAKENTALVINFGDGDTSGIFTFTNTDTNTEAIALASITVKGSAGGTITKVENAGAVTATTATIETTVAIDAGVVAFAAVNITETGVLTVKDTATVGAVTGTGVLAYEGVLPANMTGVTDAAKWTGTLALVSTPSQSDIAFNSLGNASSTVRLQDYTGSLSNKTDQTPVTCYNPKLEIKGTNTINSATQYAIPHFKGSISGDGTIIFSAQTNTNYLFSGDFSGFTGTMSVTESHGTNAPKVLLGNAGWVNWDSGWGAIAENSQGKIVIATTVTLNGTFCAVNGVKATESAILSGTGTLSIPSGKTLTYNSTASSTFAGKIAGEGGLAVSSGTLELQAMSDFRGAVNLTGGKLVFNNTKTGDYTNEQNEHIPNNTVILFKSGDASITVGESATVELKAGVIYRKFVGTGNILVTGDFTMGGASDALTMTDGFTGTITVEADKTLTLANWNEASDVLDASELVVNGSIVKQDNAKSVKATVAKLSGAGMLNIPVILANGATVTAPSAVKQALTVTDMVTVNGTATMTGNFKVAGLGGSGTLAVADGAMGTLTVTGTSTFTGSLNGVALVVGDNAHLTLFGTTSTASTIAGAGSLTVVGRAGNLSILTLTGQSEFDGKLSITDYSKLQLTGVGEGEAAMPAALRIGGVLELDQGAELVTITSNYPDARITIASAATIISNAIDHSANMVIESRALLDVTSGALSLNAVELPAGQYAGVVRVRETATSGVLRVQKGFPEDLSPSNFELEKQDNTLYFFVDSVNRQVGLVKVLADISKMTEVEKQSIFRVGYYWGYPIGAEIENAGVTEIFKGEYNNAYQFEYDIVYDEEDKLSLNLRYSVKFGISEIKNARIQEDKSILVDVTALVEPYAPAPGGKISFNRGVDVVLTAEGLGDLKTVRIKDDTTREVTFTDVSLPVQQSGAGTYKLNVSAKTEQQQPQP